MSRAITAPMTEPIRPLVRSSRVCPKIRLASRPPMNDPTIPSSAVPRMPIGSRPGTISRARPPAINPTRKSESRKTSMRSLLFPGRCGPASPAGHECAGRKDVPGRGAASASAASNPRGHAVSRGSVDRSDWLRSRLDPLLQPSERPGDDHLHRLTADERRDGEAGIDFEVVGDRGRVGSRGGGGHDVGALDQLHIAPWLALPGKSALGIAVGENVANRLDLRIELEGGPGRPALVVAVDDGGLLELVHPLGERVDVGHHLEDRLGRGLYFYGLAA